ncbi:CoA-binding protein [Clostridium sediminicola]|uniref:CoA-binding protein n=1 Tax=Clostridium sediminicola TaxID=3114879 RepID=UPI0031F1E204
MDIKELFNYKNWVVIGSTTKPDKFAYKVSKVLNASNFNVADVYPTDKTGKAYKSLEEVPFKPDCVDLCINAKFGIDFVKKAKEMGIDKFLIQPGAESEEILNYCKENNLTAIEGCALVQAKQLFGVDHKTLI